MHKTSIFAVLYLGLLWSSGCSNLQGSDQGGFTYQNLPVATESVISGEGSTILFRGTPLPLSGKGIRVGDSLRAVFLTRFDLSMILLAEAPGSVRVISVVPSIDTKVCEQQTHYLSEKNQGLDQRVRLITISIDTPFAQQRFAKEALISNVEFLSDYREAQFGKTHGLFLEGPHVLSRAIMVVDAMNVIRHLQVTPDLGQLPDMEKAFQMAQSLIQ